MYEMSQEILAAMSKSETIFTALLDGVTPERAASAREAEGEWSVVEILCHLRDAEEIAMQRNNKMRGEEHPVIQSWDADELAEARNYAAETFEDAIEGFFNWRQQHIKMLETFAPGEWLRTGEHTEAGQITILSHMLHMVAHDFDHAAQMARALEKA